ncbi:MAG: SpoIIE family protein phosphatase [Planctomycetota bacterium]
MVDQEHEAERTGGFTARLPLKVLTPIALVLPLIVAVAVIGVVVFVQGRSAAAALEARGVEQVHGRIGDRLRALLDGPRRWHALVREQIEAGVLDVDRPRSWRAPLFEQRHAFDAALAGVCWGDEAGRAVWVFRYPGRPGWQWGIRDEETGGVLEEWQLDADGEPVPGSVRRSAYDPRERPWYRLGVEASSDEPGAAVWGEPYAWTTDDRGGVAALGLPYAAAVHDGAGRRLGVLDTELSLADLSAFMRGLKIGRSGIAVVTDTRGRLVATSTGARLADDDLGRISALASEDADVRALARRWIEVHGEGVPSLTGGRVTEVELERGTALMSVSRFKTDGGLDWLVATAVPVADFTEGVHAIRARALRIVLAAVGLTLLMGMGLAAWLVRPMLRITDHARRVGAGDLESRLELNQARELVELSGEMNRMTDGLRDRLALRKSLRHASEVQQSLLPNADLDLPGFDIVGHCDYCDETGGDYYDYLADAETHETGAAVVIGDVMGHGIAAAMLMATARGVLRSRSRSPGSSSAPGIADLLTHLNKMLVEVTGGTKFMTMLIVNLDPAFGELRWSTAGHDPPMIYHPHTDSFREPDGGGLPLGVLPDEAYETHDPEKLPPGTVVLIATDGMWETRNADREMHGKQRLQNSIRRHAARDAAGIRDGLLADLHAFRGDAPRDDDETFVVIKAV